MLQSQITQLGSDSVTRGSILRRQPENIMDIHPDLEDASGIWVPDDPTHGVEGI
jgi:hypothetical protein